MLLRISYGENTFTVNGFVQLKTVLLESTLVENIFSVEYLLLIVDLHLYTCI